VMCEVTVVDIFMGCVAPKDFDTSVDYLTL
jgi:hypothetical protein